MDIVRDNFPRARFDRLGGREIEIETERERKKRLSRNKNGFNRGGRAADPIFGQLSIALPYSCTRFTLIPTSVCRPGNGLYLSRTPSHRRTEAPICIDDLMTSNES